MRYSHWGGSQGSVATAHDFYVPNLEPRTPPRYPKNCAIANPDNREIVMSSVTSARHALRELAQWANLEPSEPIGMDVQRRDGNWVIVVNMPLGHDDAREWPPIRDAVPVIVEHQPLPRLRIGGGRLRAQTMKLGKA